MSFYVTTPIYYPNGAPHLGHAYTTVIADFLARYHRLKGEPTYLLTGTDENSQKVLQEAKKQGRPVADVLNENVATFHALFDTLGISYDQFIRTSDKDAHWPGALELWNRLVASGDLYKKKYKGLYCVGSESFVTEKDLRPGGLCPDHDEQPIEVEEENWFFKLSKYQSFIVDEISSGRFEILPESRRNETLSFLKEPLEDISFSRVQKEGEEPWGIPVPNDPSQTMYVWCDALTNYISALGFGRSDVSLFEKFWPVVTHIVGKDILRFHAIYWPAMLKAANLAAPKRLFVHGLITSGGRKMSKSIGNVIDPQALINDFGPEALRAFFAKEMSAFEDPEMTPEAFAAAYNANLANGIGNLVSRAMKMATSYEVDCGDLSGVKAQDLPEWPAYSAAFEAFDVPKAAAIVWAKAAAADRFVEETQPFKAIKTDPNKAKSDVAHLVREVYGVALLLEPILPNASAKIRDLVLSRRAPSAPLFARKD
ncbi:MAG TPA: methionine--tRNA ligase [Candidatus Paceibacterota bacterium]